MSKNKRIFWSEWDSPLGIITLGKSEKGLMFLEFAPSNEALCSMKQVLNKYQITPQFEKNEQVVRPITEQLKAYFSKTLKKFTIDLDLVGTPFQQKVWSALQQIPYGETRSYRELAEMINQPKAVRAVGGANNKNPVSIIIPCHRVIGADGSLVGYGGGIAKKKYLLQLEGVSMREK